MATSNIQETGLENSIFFLEPDTSQENIDDYRNMNDAFDEDCPDEIIIDSISENFWDYINECLFDNMELTEIDVSVFNHYEPSDYCDSKGDWIDINLKIKIKPCYYVGANLIIECSEDLEELELSDAGQKTIDIAIRKLEKEMRKHSIELGVTGRFSNGETIYHKI